LVFSSARACSVVAILRQLARALRVGGCTNIATEPSPTALRMPPAIIIDSNDTSMKQAER
jgi:hypothetical protein